MNNERRRKELANFLRTRRERLSPHEAGLQAGASRRRTPGLRREEVASLSGISLPWYTALEQGRDIQVSEQVLESLVRALRLSNDERNHLFALANPSLPPNAAADESVPPALQQILDRLGTYPAYVIDKRWNVSAWNQMASNLCGDFHQLKEIERNMLWRVFVLEKNKARIANWEDVATLLLAHFRSRYVLHMNDPWYQELVSKLCESSQEFREWWGRHDVSGNSEGEQVMLHPEAGRLTFRYNTFAVSESGDFVMRVYTPIENTGTNEQLEGLL
ncbi:helix-turn-helix transcriptional regulator [Paenibacillus rigui]|uniref:Transcriptional regulator n=1 Tax=Paenibacillus rigui TaxID=554312 RepID=A0A229UU04_9BACL|nr:helix-turn-helix transcriptional regulator [Paenibacillus rigui]OXM86645.1 transcriptional regulator [Paenibacillus rigui]